MPQIDGMPGADGGGLIPTGVDLEGVDMDQMAGVMFGQWAGYAYHSERFRPAVFVEALTYRDLGAEARAGYDAPFPTRDFMAGPRSFPSLLRQLAGRTSGPKTALTGYTRPFVTIFGGNDPGLAGDADDQQWIIDNIPGAAGQAHHRYRDASHFLQEDQGEDIARRLLAFIDGAP
jgi:haloalkane dehalogenase